MAPYFFSISVVFLNRQSIPLLDAQPEHAIGKSRPAGTAENHERPGDSERTPNVRMTIDEDSRDSEPDTQCHAQAAIRSP